MSAILYYSNHCEHCKDLLLSAYLVPQLKTTYISYP